MTISNRPAPSQQHSHGFTLLEVMLVLLLMGLTAGYVVFNAFGSSQSDQLKQEVKRMQVLTDMASDYAVMNQQQLGIRIEPRDGIYYFVFLDDDDRWQRLDAEKVYQEHQLPEPFFMSLNLDDLPWNQDQQLFDRDVFDEQFSLDDADIEVGDDAQKRLPPPQIMIMSSGEITPFVLTFHFEPGFGDESPVYFQLQNQDVPPLEFTGPLDQIEL